MVLLDGHSFLTAEEKRLEEDRNREKYWKKWGPYVAERQWATGNHPETHFSLSLVITIPPPLMGLSP